MMVKWWLACEADCSLPYIAEVRNGEAIPTLSHTSSLCGALLVKHRENFTSVLRIFILCIRSEFLLLKIQVLEFAKEFTNHLP